MADTHWSKDFVEHLRTVHFALIAICVGLIIAMMTDNKSYEDKMSIDLQKMVELQHEWDTLRSKLYTDKVATEIEHGEFLIRTYEISVQGLSKNPFADGEWRGTITIQEVPPMKIGNVVQKLTYGSLESAPDTLDHFEDIWNSSDPETFVVPIEGISCQVLAPQSLTNKDQCKAEFEMKTASRAADTRLSILWSQEEVPIDSTTYTIEDVARFIAEAGPKSSALRGSPFKKIRLETKSKRVSVHLSDLWFTAFGENRRGTFETEFPELTQLRKMYGGLKISDLVALISSTKAKSDRTFTAFGLSIPLEAITSWGFLGMLLVQLYFMLHLQALSGKIPPDATGWEVAWIGVYKSRLAVICSTITYSALPVLTGTLLLSNFYQSNGAPPFWRSALLLPEFATCVGLAIYSVRHMRRMRECAPWASLSMNGGKNESKGIWANYRGQSASWHRFQQLTRWILGSRWRITVTIVALGALLFFLYIYCFFSL